MPPEEETAPEPTEKKERLGAIKGLATIGIILAVMVGAGWFVGQKLATMSRMAGSGQGGLEGTEEVEKPEDQRPSGAPIYYDPIELIVNIEDKTIGIDRFLIVEILLQLESEGLKKELAMIDPEIKDRLISVLRSKTYDDLRGAQGQDALSRELVESVNALLETGRVVDAFFNKFQVQ